MCVCMWCTSEWERASVVCVCVCVCAWVCQKELRVRMCVSICVSECVPRNALATIRNAQPKQPHKTTVVGEPITHFVSCHTKVLRVVCVCVCVRKWCVCVCVCVSCLCMCVSTCGPRNFLSDTHAHHTHHTDARTHTHTHTTHNNIPDTSRSFRRLAASGQCMSTLHRSVSTHTQRDTTHTHTHSQT